MIGLLELGLNFNLGGFLPTELGLLENLGMFSFAIHDENSCNVSVAECLMMSSLRFA